MGYNPRLLYSCILLKTPIRAGLNMQPESMNLDTTLFSRTGYLIPVIVLGYHILFSGIGT